MNLNERLKEFIASKRLSISEFERICGLSNGYVKKCTTSVGKRGLGDIRRAFPDLNTDWLLTGEGEMLRPSAIQTNQNGDNIHGQTITVNKSETEKFLEALATCHEIIRKKDEQIDKLLNMLNK